MSESDVVSRDFAIFTMVESLGSVRHLLFFVRFCLDIPLLLEISFYEMSFSLAILSTFAQNLSLIIYPIDNTI